MMALPVLVIRTRELCLAQLEAICLQRQSTFDSITLREKSARYVSIPIRTV